jgi:hypothetical protein
VRLLVRPQAITPALACRCALRVKTTTGQMDAAWDGATRLRNAVTTGEFIQGAIRALEDVKTDCYIIGLPQVEDSLNLAFDAVNRGDYGKAAGLISGANGRLSDALISCMGAYYTDETVRRDCDPPSHIQTSNDSPGPGGAFLGEAALAEADACVKRKWGEAHPR